MFTHNFFLKFEIQKCGQILCAHKTHFLMPGHICDQACENRSSNYTHLMSDNFPCEFTNMYHL